MTTEEEPLEPPIDILPSEHNADLGNFYDTVKSISFDCKEKQNLYGSKKVQRFTSIARDRL